MVKCTACGTDIPADAPFCNHCGQLLLAQPPAPPQIADSLVPAPVPPPILQAVAPADSQPAAFKQPIRTWPFWLAGAGFLGIVLVVWSLTRPHASHTDAGTVNMAPPYNPPPNQITLPVATIKPSIVLFEANPPYDRDGKWYTHLQWKSIDATSLVLDTGKERFDLDPGMGSRDVELKEVHTLLHLTAYNGHEADAKDTTVDRLQEATQAADTPQNTNPNPTLDATSKIERFDVGERVDTPDGSALRVHYQVAGEAELHLLYADPGDQDLKLTGVSGYIDLFTSRKVVLTLKAITPSGTVTKELTIAPDPNVDTEAGSQETGGKQHDMIDIVSTSARLRDFSKMNLVLTDPLAGYLASPLQIAHKEDFALYRNAIYARHGYHFNKAKYQNFFAKRPWYLPDTSDPQVADKRLNELERNNAKWLLKQEQNAPE